MKLLQIASLVAMTSMLGACSMADRISNIGEAPVLTAIKDPTVQPGYRPVHMPMPEVVPVAYQPNSLFRTNAKGFFKDQRAHRIGDILTVMVTISDKAQIANKTARGRASTNSAGVNGVFGALFDNFAAPELGTSATLGTESDLSDSGTGSVNRSETLETQVAAVVTQVLPNGNLVIEGRQEVRVNFEVRDLIVAGIVRPEDVGADNTIPSAKIAEARIAYGGRGQITDVQQPRYGAQVMDAILPF